MRGNGLRRLKKWDAKPASNCPTPPRTVGHWERATKAWSPEPELKAGGFMTIDRWSITSSTTSAPTLAGMGGFTGMSIFMGEFSGDNLRTAFGIPTPAEVEAEAARKAEQEAVAAKRECKRITNTYGDAW